MTLTDDVEVQYKVDELYAPECDRGIIWNDAEVGIEWPMEIQPVLSEKTKSTFIKRSRKTLYTGSKNENFSNRL